MVYKEKLPLEAVAGGELRLALVDDRKLPQQLRGGQPARRHEHRLIRRHPPSLLLQPCRNVTAENISLPGNFELINLILLMKLFLRRRTRTPRRTPLG